MKNLLTIMSLLFAGSLFAGPLHLDLEMTSEEYQLLLKKMDQKNKGLSADDPAIAEAIRLGEKLSHWIKLINEARRPEQAIRLTSAATRRGIPIDQPNMYSPSIIKTETVRILGQLPNSMKEVLLSRSDAPATTGMDDETFIKYARLVDRNYQSAARYRGVDQYRAEYIKAANYDVRGYYYLTKNNIGEDELQDVNKIEPNRLNLIQNALVQLCQNSNHQLSRCRTEVKKALAKNKLAGVYHRYINGAKRVWGDFFRIPTFAIRQDVSWSSSSAVVPFNTSGSPEY